MLTIQANEDETYLGRLEGDKCYLTCYRKNQELQKK